MKFGDKSRYYSAEEIEDTSQGSLFHKTHEKLISSLPQDCEDAVRRSVNQWNQKIRDHLRGETGLKLIVGEERSAVKIVVDDGYPLPFIEMIDKFPDIIWELKRRKLNLESALIELKFVHDNHAQIAQSMAKEVKATSKDIDNTIVFIRDIFDVILAKEEKKVDDVVKQVDMDILGAYFYHRQEVRIYWKVIGLFAGILKVSTEDLAAAVLIHELAHAYSHIGRDIDGKQWDTKAFAATDSDIVEGIAQFYTWAVSSKLEDKAPGVKRAYESFLKLQSGPYIVHNKWLENASRIGEIIRACLIYARTHEINKIADFEREVLAARKRLIRQDA